MATKHVWAEGDPFGYYLQDGVPCIWITVWRPSNAPTQDSYIQSVKWFVSGANSRGSIRTVPWTADNIADLNRQGYNAEQAVSARITIANATLDDIDAECRQILKIIKSGALKKLPK